MTNLLLKFRRYAKWKKCQLFHATDFQSLMYPCFILCSILGIFPYNINASTFKMSKQRYILSTIVICSVCISILVVLYEIDVTKKEYIPLILESYCFLILGCFIVVITYISCSRRMLLLQTIMDISSRVSADSYRKLSRLIHAKDIFGFFFLIGQLYCFTLNYINSLYKILIVYIILVTFQMDMLYVNCVCVVKACFKEINDNLMNLRELVVNDEPHLVRRIYHKYKNAFLLREFKALKKQHLIVSETVQMLNMIFGLQLLITIVITFSEVTFHLYYCIMYWKTDILMKNINFQFYDVLLISSVIYYSIKITLTGWACDTGKDQATRIGITVHEIINNIIDKQIRDELRLFSLQILQRENTFSAKGLIIDASLLIAIVGNITTYLLILVQFLVAEQVCNEKLANNVTSK